MTRTLICLGLMLTFSMSVFSQETKEKPVTGKPAAKKDEAKKDDTEKDNDKEKKAEGKGLVVFDGKTLNGWKLTNFGGEGDVYVEEGAIILRQGNDMTGITWKDEKTIPRSNYVLELEAQRVDGSDFFCGLTFPVGKDPCSLILGGWGGGVCGLSSINGFDASENETTAYQKFDNKKWYRIRLQVTDERIEVWLDGKSLIDQPTKDRKFSIRLECELSKPLGFSTWQTSAALRKLKLHPMTAEEIAKAKAQHEEKLKNE